MKRAAVLLLVLAGCSVFRQWQNADARLIAGYHDVRAAYDVIQMALKMGRITPEVAQVAKDGVDIALRHCDEAKDILVAAKAGGRTAAPEELKQAWSILGLVFDAIDVVHKYLVEKGVR